jgi:CxxC motif-containing protein (DUF1111 family)
VRWALAIVVAAACGDNAVSDDRLGGDTTVDDRTSSAFTHPLATLSMDDQNRHHTGSAPFDFHWETPQLGPLFNNDGCISCHAANGRGESQIAPDPFGSQALVRCSMPSGIPEVPGGQAPVPGLGTQLQDHSINDVLPEVAVTLTWTEHAVAYDDGTSETLRSPNLAIRRFDSSPFPADALLSYRQALPVIGMGLLDAIPEADILANSRPLGGHANHVWNPITGEMQLGRFGHKASQPTVELQTAGAFANDAGLSSKIFPDPDGNLDVANMQLDDTVFFVRTIAVPAAATRDGAAWRGSELFESFGCTSCHVTTFVTGDSDIPELAHQTIHPYTDLLLHDMGEGLADHRPDFEATGSEWRTPPLWGVGLAQVVSSAVTFMHDGRARTLAEAILWHGGEAMPAREAFRTAAVADRVALVAFLSTL